jgi:LPXTG-motif cell wall-anchored protein
MRFFKVILMGLALSLLAGTFLNPVRADKWNKKTILTFSQPIEIPGKVLPAGTYTFRLLDSPSYRHIVQIWNEDGSQLITTILAVPNYRLEPKDETVIKFRERPGDSPEALRAWFYPGDNFGQEFVYPKARAIQLAQASHEIVPAETVEPTESTLKTVPLVAITPENKEEPVTEAIQVLPLHHPETPAPAPVTVAKELPKTGSSIPLIGLLGVAFIGLALGLKLLAKQLS